MQENLRVFIKFRSTIEVEYQGFTMQVMEIFVECNSVLVEENRTLIIFSGEGPAMSLESVKISYIEFL